MVYLALSSALPWSPLSATPRMLHSLPELSTGRTEPVVGDHQEPGEPVGCAGTVPARSLHCGPDGIVELASCRRKKFPHTTNFNDESRYIDTVAASLTPRIR